MLGSVKQFQSYRVAARDGAFGLLNDFYFDGKSWCLRYMAVKAGSFLRRRQVLLPAAMIECVDRGRRLVHVTVTKGQLHPDSEEAKGLATLPVARLGSGVIAVWTDAGKSGRLRSARSIRGYRIQATDGQAGFIHDLLVDLESQAVCSAVISRRRWLPGQKVELPRCAIRGLIGATRLVFVDLSRQGISNGRRYSPAAYSV